MSTIPIAPFGQGIPVGYSSANRTILLKFFFTNRGHVPELPERSAQGLGPGNNPILSGGGFLRPDNAKMDQRHAYNAFQRGHGHLAEVGRIRAGRVDTGEHFIDNIHNTHAGCVVRGLDNIGYKLSQLHWYLKRDEMTNRPGGPIDKYVAVIGMVTGADAIELPNKSLEKRRILAATCWQWCHGYANPDGVITLNFGGFMPGGKPQHSVVVRDHKLTAARITELVTEENE